MRDRILVVWVFSVIVVMLSAWLFQWLRKACARSALRGYGCLVSGHFTGWFVTITPKTTGRILCDVGKALVALRSAGVSLVGSSDDDLRQLEPYLLAMKELWLDVQSEHITDVGLQYLKRLHNAYRIDVRETSVTRDGWLAFQKEVQCPKVPWREAWLKGLRDQGSPGGEDDDAVPGGSKKS